jgi:LPXTG-motif cell wall-anchored protein
MDDNTTKIILGVIAIITALVGGALYSKKRRNKVKQTDIKIKGDKNRIVGGDDNSK